MNSAKADYKNHFPYDVIAVLGYDFDRDSQLPEHVKKRLKIVSYMYHWAFASSIALSGKWPKSYDRRGETPSQTEAQAMGQVLRDYSILPQALFYEEESQDTIGNAYYLKRNVFIPNKFRNALIICADYHVARVQYIFGKIYGNSFNLDYYGTESGAMREAQMAREMKKLDEARQIMEGMRDGHESYLDRFLSGEIAPGRYAKRAVAS